MQPAAVRRLVVLVVGAVAVLVLTAFLLQRYVVDDTRLVTDTEGTDGPSATMAPLEPGADRFFVVSPGGLCIESGIMATITSIEPRDAHGGLEVTAFSVFQRSGLHPIYGERRGRLGDMPDFFGGNTVGGECGKAPYEEIAMELYKPDAKDAWASDFTVHYVADGERRTTNIQVGVALCEKKGCNPFKV